MQLLDTNVILRFLRKDHSIFSKQAKKIMQDATSSEKLYLDEVVCAETVWVLHSYYHESREAISTHMYSILSLPYIVSDRKDTILQALVLFKNTTFNFIDCWLYAVSREKKLKLATFDAKLAKLSI